jgi:proteasome lid subunit RPN8/RPN11
VLEDIAAHAREALPNECCGLLLGQGETIDEAVRARNQERSPTRFLIDPADHFAAIRLARATGREVVGSYHSHPTTPPIPSAADLAEAHFPDSVYVIVRPCADETPADIRAYRLGSGNFEPLELVPVT